jgi:hypothetical protein
MDKEKIGGWASRSEWGNFGAPREEVVACDKRHAGNEYVDELCNSHLIGKCLNESGANIDECVKEHVLGSYWKGVPALNIGWRLAFIKQLHSEKYDGNASMITYELPRALISDKMIGVGLLMGIGAAGRSGSIYPKAVTKQEELGAWAGAGMSLELMPIQTNIFQLSLVYSATLSLTAGEMITANEIFESALRAYFGGKGVRFYVGGGGAFGCYGKDCGLGYSAQLGFAFSFADGLKPITDTPEGLK